jgi:hypothetical protein
MLVSSIKIASPCCNHHATLHALKQSHSPQNLEPLEAGSWGDHDGGVFVFSLCVVCCVCACITIYILWYDTPTLVSGPVNSQICTKDSVLKELLQEFILLPLFFR